MRVARSAQSAEILQDRDEISMRIALMQEQRLADIRGDLQLPFERLALRRPRRKITVVIQPAFADRNDLRRLEQDAQFGVRLVGIFDGVVGMHTGCGVQASRMVLRQCKRVA